MEPVTALSSRRIYTIPRIRAIAETESKEMESAEQNKNVTVRIRFPIAALTVGLLLH
jgi:hypothetical protein